MIKNFTNFTFKERSKVKKALVRAEFFVLNKLELEYDRIDAMLYTGQLTGLGTEQGINANRMGI